MSLRERERERERRHVYLNLMYYRNRGVLHFFLFRFYVSLKGEKTHEPFKIKDLTVVILTARDSEQPREIEQTN